MLWWQALIIGVAGGTVGAEFVRRLFTFRTERAITVRTVAESSSEMSDAYAKMFADMRLELERLRVRVQASEMNETRLTSRVMQLERALFEAKIPIPEEKEPITWPSSSTG